MYVAGFLIKDKGLLRLDVDGTEQIVNCENLISFVSKIIFFFFNHTKVDVLTVRNMYFLLSNLNSSFISFFINFSFGICSFFNKGSFYYKESDIMSFFFNYKLFNERGIYRIYSITITIDYHNFLND